MARGGVREGSQVSRRALCNLFLSLFQTLYFPYELSNKICKFRGSLRILNEIYDEEMCYLCVFFKELLKKVHFFNFVSKN